MMCASASIHAKQLAFSFDDGLNPDANPEAAKINNKILSQLKQAHLHSIVYPSLIKLGGTAGLDLIADWGKQGHKIGNHSERHISLNKPDTNIQNYIEGIANTERKLKPLVGWTPRYRFPFLKEGDTKEKRNAVRKWLDDHGYQSGAVSIDASDWFYNLKYLEYSKNSNVDKLATLKKAYIKHLLGRADYYDELAQRTLGYAPKHVILLHTSKINAESLTDIITAFKAQGWEWIDTETAYADPLYKKRPNVLPAGESIIWSLAKENGNKTLRYPAEDAPYELENLKNFGLD